ncbi:MAG: septal ring lytic transglycosylase RlpA family protein [Betaproteobacteria bacterium]|nr:septal ring lytic transglycosylase RlpA family protein [Betaproteobacteria bacterium]
MAFVRIYGVLLMMALLSACGGRTVTAPNVPALDTRASAPTAKPTPPGKGGYYLDDGPGDNPPADMDLIPDAQLKTEPLLARANKPYSALGQRYIPMIGYLPYVKQGTASWYGKRYHGKKTSSGEVYDMYGMTGAHPILPIPSYVRVTNPANGRSVIVRVNDRGPFKHDRLIDLSYAAAYKLRLISQGSGLVEVQALDTSPEALKAIEDKRNATIVVATPAPTTQNVESPNATASAISPTPERSAVSGTAKAVAPPSGYYVQAGAFKSEANGTALQKKISGLDSIGNASVVSVYNDGLYRIKVGPFDSRQEADVTANLVHKQLNIRAVVTNQ